MSGFHDIHIISGLPITMRGPSYTCIRLAEAMAGPRVRVHVHAPCGLRFSFAAIGNDWPRIPGNTKTLRIVTEVAGSRLRRRSEKRLLDLVNRSRDRSIVYTFGEVSLDLSRALRDMGAFVVREKINIGKKRALRILAEAHAPFGIYKLSGLNAAGIAKEEEEMRICDAVFSPSPMVAASLADYDMDMRKIIPASYGWEPDRFPDRVRERRTGKPVFLFVGHICIRKGVHILLQAWERASVAGRLVLVGSMDPIIRKTYGRILARDDVEVISFTKDIGAHYRRADWFIFPSLEEGGPQVTYEAGAHGLPALVSRMGAGAFLRHDREGRIITGSDPAVWAEAIAAAAEDRTAAERYSAAARARAELFTWDRVGAARREALLDAVQAAGSNPTMARSLD